MRFWTGAFFVGLFIFFFLQTMVLASEQCPKKDSPEATAMKYQLYTAYQVGFDGYKAPCILQCFESKNCQATCRKKEALRLLQNKFQELLAKKGFKRCPAMTVGCVEQCMEHGSSCKSACGNDKPVAIR